MLLRSNSGRWKRDGFEACRKNSLAEPAGRCYGSGMMNNITRHTATNGCFLTGAAPACGCPASFVSPKRDVALPPELSRFFGGARSGETSIILSAFAHDAVIDDSGRRFVGRDEIGDWIAREFEHDRATISLRAARVHPDSVVVDADWRSRFYQGMARLIFQMDAGEIMHLRVFGESMGAGGAS